MTTQETMLPKGFFRLVKKNITMDEAIEALKQLSAIETPVTMLVLNKAITEAFKPIVFASNKSKAVASIPRVYVDDNNQEIVVSTYKADKRYKYDDQDPNSFDNVVTEIVEAIHKKADSILNIINDVKRSADRVVEVYDSMVKDLDTDFDEVQGLIHNLLGNLKLAMPIMKPSKTIRKEYQDDCCVILDKEQVAGDRDGYLYIRLVVAPK